MTFIVIVFGKLIEVKEDGNNIIIYNSTEKEVNEIWLKYFDLDRDYSEIKQELAKDPLLKQSIEFGYGVRVLNQDPFEMLLSFIISARNNIPSIKKTVNKISDKWGKEIKYKGQTYYAFPNINEIKDATLEEIQETGASFRSKYIIDTIKNVYNSVKESDDLKGNEENIYLKYSLRLY